MQYLFSQSDNFSDFASGHVLYHKAGLTNFPVRLQEEIFMRCLSYLNKKKNIVLYDGCCGSGYGLTVLGFLNNNIISDIYASDINNDALILASKNLSLLTTKGLHTRLQELLSLKETYQKTSHKEAVKSVQRLLLLLEKNIYAHIFQANLSRKEDFQWRSFKADIVIMDLPYANLTFWQGENSINFLENIEGLLHYNSVISIVSNKNIKLNTTGFKTLEHQLIGKRKFIILQKDNAR